MGDEKNPEKDFEKEKKKKLEKEPEKQTKKAPKPKKKKKKHIQPMYRTPEGRDLTKITDVDVKRSIRLHEKEEEDVKSRCN